MGRIPSLALLATLLLMQPRIQLAFWPVSAHCWLIVSFPSTDTPKSFSTGLLSIHSLASVSVFGIALNHVQDPALGLVESHEVSTGPPLQPVQVPLDGTSLPSSVLTAPHSLATSANLLRVHSIPLSVLLIKTLNSPGLTKMFKQAQY